MRESLSTGSQGIIAATTDGGWVQRLEDVGELEGGFDGDEKKAKERKGGRGTATM